MEETELMIKCSICGDEIEDAESHNAQPVNNGRCCGHCNLNVVIPARASELNEMRKDR